jgi:outer membrane protein assembly factor BamD
MDGTNWSSARKFAITLWCLGLAACTTTAKDETANISTEKLYAEAREEASSGSNEKAIKLYERLEGRAAGSLLGQKAQLERAYLHYKSDERAEALSVVERFLKLHPSSPALDYALYLQGLINFNGNLGLLGKLTKRDLSERDQQASRDAYQSFKQLVEQYPQSKYTPDALERMQYIVNSLASYEVHVARYYFRRGAYVASSSRAQQAIQEFPSSPSTQEALTIMVQSYDKLGLGILRDDAARVLRQNFPDSNLVVTPK